MPQSEGRQENFSHSEKSWWVFLFFFLFKPIGSRKDSMTLEKQPAFPRFTDLNKEPHRNSLKTLCLYGLATT